MTKGLGKPHLRDSSATTEMTAAEFLYLVAHPNEVPDHMRQVYENELKRVVRSNAAKKAVATKRAKYRKWPGGRKKS